MNRVKKLRLIEKNKGFSLVEVLIAMAILALVSLPILSIFTGAAKGNSKAKRVENAQVAASNIIEEIKNTKLEDLEGANLNYNYELEESNDNGTYKYMISSKNKDFFLGNDNEKFYIEATLDPTFYTDGEVKGDVNASNNVNSYSLTSTYSVSSDSNIIYRDDTINNEASTYFKEATGVYFNKQCITKETNFDVKIIKDTSSSDLADYIETVTASIKYKYNDNTGNVGSVDDYERSFIVGNQKVKASDVNGELVISCNPKYSSFAKPIYFFYTIYNDFDSNGIIEIVDGKPVQYAKDKINISYSYDKNFNPNVKFEGLNLYLVEQNKGETNGQIRIKKDNVNINFYEDRLKSKNANSEIFGLSKDYVASVYSNIYNWELNLNEGIQTGQTNYIYRLIVKVYYREKNEDSLVTTMITTKVW